MPAPPASFYKRSESLAEHITDLANAFSNAASVLSQQYTNLNKATNGLLDGTYPWQGQGANSFSDTWQTFGNYMQLLQKTCEDTHNSLTKFSKTLSDIEAQQVWDILLTVVGGILTIVSFAAMIAELGLNPFVDGFFAFISTFTEQDGAAVVNASEEITQADSQAATELQTIEDDMVTSPVLTGSGPNSAGVLSDATSPVNMNEMIQALDEEIAPNDFNPNNFYARGGGKQFQYVNDSYLNDRPGMNQMPPGLNDPEAQYWIQEIEKKGVPVLWNHDVQVDLLNQEGYGITYNDMNYNMPNPSPAYMAVGLSPDADATTVYEEYLHVTEAENRGWLPYNDVQTSVAENYAEEIRVEYQVMQNAQRLGTTQKMWNILSANRKEYIRRLEDIYNEANKNRPIPVDIPADIQQYFQDPPKPPNLPNLP